ncbi:hypothetical protein [Desulfatirhabdium butyrativorans]|uniref:hypothetical protein n=1 Tax=Desulfatirhabdium butyrativorans TaxID=340467 RepID=UPI000400272A|nr:hypothetical protein [Desulfatirhabdium butyrativorans]
MFWTHILPEAGARRTSRGSYDYDNDYDYDYDNDNDNDYGSDSDYPPALRRKEKVPNEHPESY